MYIFSQVPFVLDTPPVSPTAHKLFFPPGSQNVAHLTFTLCALSPYNLRKFIKINLQIFWTGIKEEPLNQGLNELLYKDWDKFTPPRMAEVKVKFQTLRPFHPMDGAH